MISMDIGVWAAVLIILAAFSFIVKDNPFFRIAEAVMVGTTAGVFAAQGLENLKKLALIPLINNGQYISIIPMLLGILLFTRISKRYGFMSRIPIAIMLGAGAGVAIGKSIATEIIGQAYGLFKPMPSSLFEIMNALIIFICTIAVLLLFTYTRSHTGALSVVTRTGRYALMLGLGVIYAGHIYARAAWILPALQIIIWDWLQIII